MGVIERAGRALAAGKRAWDGAGAPRPVVAAAPVAADGGGSAPRVAAASSRSTSARSTTGGSGGGSRRGTGTVGFIGQSRFSGLQMDDYNPDLSGKRGIQELAKMLKRDGQARAIRSVINLPILSTAWYVDPPKGASQMEREAADLLTADLFGGMEGSFTDALREVLKAVWYGFSVPEIEWGERDGRTCVCNLWPRNLELVENWLYDPKGRLAGYLYAGNRIVGNGLTDSQPSVEYARVPVPLERTVHAVYEPENGGPVGLGIGRSTWTHYYHKQSYYNIAGIGVERNWLGVPVAEAGEGARWEDREDVLEILAAYRTAEDSGIALPFGWKLSGFNPGGSLPDIQPLLDHQDALMARAALAQFLVLGQANHGTQGLASEHVKIFLDAEDAVCRWVEQLLTQQLLARWCKLNYETARSTSAAAFRCPQLRHRSVRSYSLEGISRALSGLVAGELITPTEQDETQLRVIAELPEIDAAQLKTAREARRRDRVTQGRRDGRGKARGTDSGSEQQPGGGGV